MFGSIARFVDTIDKQMRKSDERIERGRAKGRERVFMRKLKQSSTGTKGCSGASWMGKSKVVRETTLETY